MHNGSVPRTVAFRARFLSAVNNVVKVGMSESKRLPQEVHIKCCKTSAYIRDAGEFFWFVRPVESSKSLYIIKYYFWGAQSTKSFALFVHTKHQDICTPMLRCPKSFLLKELFPPGKITVFTFVLCPHTTPPLDLLPWKMKKNQVYKSH